MMDLINIQIIFLVVSFLLTSFTALLPILVVWFKSKHTGDEQVSILIDNCLMDKQRMFFKFL